MKKSRLLLLVCFLFIGCQNEPTSEPTPEPMATTEVTESMTQFEIIPEQSTAYFAVTEWLKGQDVDVVGKTNTITGTVQFDPADLSTATISPIIIDAYSIKTPIGGRNLALRKGIFKVDKYPNITYTPTELIGLPEQVKVGDVVTFDIVGDMTIRDVTQPITMSTVVTYTSDVLIMGSAETIVIRDDFGLSIPELTSIVRVPQEITVGFEFTATKIDTNPTNLEK